MQNQPPLISIGLPVYNGENFISQAFDCILAQTITDFEVIITDNASQDATESICRKYAAQDGRIRYLRNERNLGAADNFNLGFKLSRGQYFKWVTHDDLWSPTFLERCLAALEREPNAVLAFPRISFVQSDGALIRRQGKSDLSILQAQARNRIKQIVDFQVDDDGVFWAVFGLIKRSALEKTGLIGKFDASDQVLLLELLLLGGFCQVPEDLFFRREHPESYSKRLDRTGKERVAWFWPEHRKRIVFPTFRLLGEHCRAIARSPLGLYAKVYCWCQMFRRFAHYYRYFAGDVLAACKSWRNLRPPVKLTGKPTNG